MSGIRHFNIMFVVETTTTNMSTKQTFATCKQQDGTCDRKSIPGFPICRRCLDHHIKRRYQDNLLYFDIQAEGIDLTIIIEERREIGHAITYYNDVFSVRNVSTPRYIIKGIRQPKQRIRDANADEVNLVKLIYVPSSK